MTLTTWDDAGYVEIYGRWESRSTRPFETAALRRLFPDDADGDGMEGGSACTGVTLLEVAAGSGHLSIRAARAHSGLRVKCTDGSRAFVDVAQRNVDAEEAGLGDRVSCSVMDGEEMVDVADASVDAVACLFGVSLMGRGARFFPAAFRVLREGGRCVMTTWHDTFLVDMLVSALAMRDTAAAEEARRRANSGRSPWSDGEWVCQQFKDAGFFEARWETVTDVQRVQRDERESFAGFVAGGPGVQRLVGMLGWPAHLMEHVRYMIAEHLDKQCGADGDGCMELSSTALVVTAIK